VRAGDTICDRLRSYRIKSSCACFQGAAFASSHCARAGALDIAKRWERWQAFNDTETGDEYPR